MTKSRNMATHSVFSLPNQFGDFAALRREAAFDLWRNVPVEGESEQKLRHLSDDQRALLDRAISATIKRMETTVFVWGHNDCDTIMADYVLSVTGRDPMAEWRQRYDDEESALSFIEAAGGNCALVERGMCSIGIEPKPGAEAVRGDVVVVELLGRQISGLFLDPRSSFKTPRGRRSVRQIPIMMAWSCV